MRRRRIIGWTFAVLGVLTLAGAVGGYLFLRSESFRKLALHTIIQDADATTGGRTEIGGLDFHFSTLTAHLYDITLHGTERSTQPPLLHIDKLTVGIKIQSILRRKVTLSELVIDHPVAHVRIDRRGNNNIPSSPPSTSSSQNDIFDLAARHVLLIDGEVTYNDAMTPVEGELYDLRTEIGFDAPATRYHGTISYDRGRLRYADNTPFQHSLNANFDATPSRFSLNSAALKVGSSAISLHAQLTDYSNPTIAGAYDIHIHSEDFAALSQPVTPAGDVSLAGTIHYQKISNQPLLRSISVDGQLGSDRLAIRLSDGRVDVRRLRGNYQLLNGTLRAHDVIFDVFDGKLTSDVDIQNLDTTPSARVRTTLKGISLWNAQRAVRGLKIKNVELLGTVDGTVEASWRGSFNNLRARADVSLVAAANSAKPYSANAIPVSGAIHASYDGARNMIAIAETTLRVPSATIVAQGELGSRSNSKSTLQIHGTVSDLHQLAGLIGALRGGQTVPIEIAGSAYLQAVLRGSMQKPTLAGQFSAQNLQVEGSQWSSASVKIQANPSGVILQDTTLVSAHQGMASLSAHVGLKNWSYLPSSPIAGSLMVQRLSVADLQHLANLHYPVSGDLSADVSFHGSQLQPAGNGTAKIDNARAYGEAFRHLATTFRGNRDSLVSTLDVSMAAGSANATLSYTPNTKAYSVRLDAPSVILQKLQIVQEKNLGVAGTLKVAASGVGTLDNPQLTATIAVPQLQLRDRSSQVRSISQIKGELRVANQRAELIFDSNVAQASIHSRGTVNLTGDYYAEATLDTDGVRLDPLLAMYVSNLPQGFQGETELHASLKGPLKDKSRIEAHLTIPTLKASYQGLEIGAASPIRVDYSNAVITLQPAEIRGTGTSLRLQGNIPVDGSSSPTVSARGSVDFRIVRIIAPDVQSSGTLSLDVHASGSAKNPTVQGQVHLQDIALSTPSAPLGVQNLSGNLDIGNSAIQVSGLAGEVGGGQVSLGGSISYRPGVQFNLTMQSKSVRLLYPDGLRTVLDGNLVFSGTKEASTLNGRVLIDSLSFTPDFDLSKFSDQFGSSTVPAEPGPADNIKLAVAVQSKGDLSANSSVVSLEGQVNLQVTGTVANPVIIGRTNLTSGELFYRNVRYQLERGIITFDNPNETEPVMNVAATTTIEQYNLTLTMRGTFDKLLTSYTSDPPLATADIINLIAQGHTTQDQTAASQSTDSILASQVTSQLTSSVQRLAGISSLQIDPLLGGNNSNPSARVAIQQRVTKNFLFTFSTDLSQPGTEIVQGDYQLNQRWSVSLTRDEVGGISVDGKYHTRF